MLLPFSVYCFRGTDVCLVIVVIIFPVNQNRLGTYYRMFKNINFTGVLDRQLSYTTVGIESLVPRYNDSFLQHFKEISR